MALLLPVPNGNPWPKPWAVQLPVLGNNISPPKPSKYQTNLKLAYSRDIRSFRKYYNKNIKQVVCSGITMPRVLSARCKNVNKLELYENSQIKSSLSNLKVLKLGHISQKKLPVKTMKHLVRNNKNLREIWFDKYDTMEALRSAIKCPRLLDSFSLGLCNVSKEKMKKAMQFLNRHKKLKEVALCSTEPAMNQQAVQRNLDKEAEDFVTFIGSLLDKPSLNALRLDVMDPKVVERGSLFEDFLVKKLQEKQLEGFDLRLALTNPKLLKGIGEELLKKMDYLGLSINGVPFQKANFWAEEMLQCQNNSKQKFMVDFRGLPELDLDPILNTLTPSLRTLDLSFNNDNCKLSCDWASTVSRLNSIESLSLNFSNCSSIAANILYEFSNLVKYLPKLRYTSLHLENIEYDEAVYLAIDKFYASIKHTPEHSLGIHSCLPKNIELGLLCSSLGRLQALKRLKLMVHLRAVESVACIGRTISHLKTLQKLELHIRTDVHECMAFELPLEELNNLNHLRLEILFRPPSEFLDNLNSSLCRLEALQHLELSILYYSKVRYSMFLSLLARVNMLKELKELEMSVNLEDENVNESVAEKNRKVKKELQELLRRHPSLNKVIFHHFVSYICFTK